MDTRHFLVLVFPVLALLFPTANGLSRPGWLRAWVRGQVQDLAQALLHVLLRRFVERPSI